MLGGSTALLCHCTTDNTVTLVSGVSGNLTGSDNDSLRCSCTQIIFLAETDILELTFLLLYLSDHRE